MILHWALIFGVNIVAPLNRYTSLARGVCTSIPARCSFLRAANDVDRVPVDEATIALDVAAGGWKARALAAELEAIEAKLQSKAQAYPLLPLVLVGHSQGANASLHIAERRLVSGLVLVSAGYTTHDRHQDSLARGQNGAVEEGNDWRLIKDWDFRAILDNVVGHSGGHADGVQDEDDDGSSAGVDRTGACRVCPDTSVGSTPGDFGTDGSRRAYRGGDACVGKEGNDQGFVLVVHGEDDAIVSVSEAHSLVAGLREAALSISAEGGTPPEISCIIFPADPGLSLPGAHHPPPPSVHPPRPTSPRTHCDEPQNLSHTAALGHAECPELPPCLINGVVSCIKGLATANERRYGSQLGK